jgi:hypothetical protein
MQVCLPKQNKLDNNLLTAEPRAVDPHCFDADADPDPAQNLDADPNLDPDPGEGGGGEGVGQPKMCIPPGKILGTPLPDPYQNVRDPTPFQRRRRNKFYRKWYLYYVSTHGEQIQ